jgi:hypothetical protein
MRIIVVYVGPCRKLTEDIFGSSFLLRASKIKLLLREFLFGINLPSLLEF